MSLMSLRNRSSKYVRAIVIVAAVGMTAAAFSGLGSSLVGRQSNQAAQQSPDEVIATVNGSPITRSDLDTILTKQLRQMEDGGNPAGLGDMSRINAQALDSAVENALTVQIAHSKGITVTDSDMAKARQDEVKALATQLGLKSSASESDVEGKLNEQGYSIDQLFNPDTAKRDLLFRKYYAYLQSANKATMADVQQEYTDLHTQHILIGNKTRPDAQAIAQANQIIAQLNKGADFAALAKQYSDDPGTKNKGGDDGWVTKDTGYVSQFMNAAHALQKGQITQQPVLAPQFGYFIIKLIDSRSSMPKNFDKIKDSELSKLTSSRVNGAYESDLTAAQASEKLVIKDNRLRLDHGVLDLYKNATGGKIDQGELQKLINGYIELAKASSGKDKAEMEAQLGQLYGETDEKDPQKKAQLQIGAFKDAIEAYGSKDSQIDFQLGILYKQVKDNANAIASFQDASSVTFDKPYIHSALAQQFTSLGQPALAANETQLAAKEQAEQPAQGGPGGMNFAPQTSSAPVTIGGKPAPAGAINVQPNGRVIGSQVIHVGPGGKILGSQPGQPAPVTLGSQMIHVGPGGKIVGPPPGAPGQPHTVSLGSQVIHVGPGGKIIGSQVIHIGPPGPGGKPGGQTITIQPQPKPAPLTVPENPSLGTKPSIMFKPLPVKPPASTNAAPAKPQATSATPAQPAAKQ